MSQPLPALYSPPLQQRTRTFVSELAFVSVPVGLVEVREQPAGELDEIVAAAPSYVHLEKMDDGQWWMSVGGIHVHFGTDEDGKHYCHWSNEGAFEGTPPASWYPRRKRSRKHKGHRFHYPWWEQQRNKLACWLFDLSLRLANEDA